MRPGACSRTRRPHRPPVNPRLTCEVLEQASKMRFEGMSLSKIVTEFHVPKTTLYRALVSPLLDHIMSLIPLDPLPEPLWKMALIDRDRKNMDTQPEAAVVNQILTGDAAAVLRTLPEASVQCVVTSPPYWGLRDYGVAGQIGRELDPDSFVEALVGVFREVRRVLREDGVLWMNLGDTYANDTKWGGATSGKHAGALHGATGIGRTKKMTGLPPKSLMMMPARVAIAMQSDGWTLRSDVIWHKSNPMPEAVEDRPTLAHEHIFLFSRSARYYYNAAAIKEPVSGTSHPRGTTGVTPKSAEPGQGIKANSSFESVVTDLVYERNARTVWTFQTESFEGAHFATFPQELARRCILTGSRVGDTVLDPFCGSGTTCAVADAHQRAWIGIELNPEYAEMARRRVFRDGAPLFSRTQ